MIFSYLFFFLNRNFKVLPVCNEPGTSITRGINVEAFRKHDLEIDFLPQCFQNGVRNAKFCCIHTLIFFSKNMNFREKLPRA